MTLRPATLADLETVLFHRREMFREMGGEYERRMDQFEEGSRLYFERALPDGSYVGVLGEMDGKVMAGGGIVIAPWPGSPLNYDPRRAWILNIYVDSEHRRKGLARVIMQALIDWCRMNGFLSVSLHASEQGRGLYTSLGFQGTNEMRLRF
jgi:GNAT superfamily N-acetyltransferase